MVNYSSFNLKIKQNKTIYIYILILFREVNEGQSVVEQWNLRKNLELNWCHLVVCNPHYTKTPQSEKTH